jgi:hypothetical protein
MAYDDFKEPIEVPAHLATDTNQVTPPAVGANPDQPNPLSGTEVPESKIAPESSVTVQAAPDEFKQNAIVGGVAGGEIGKNVGEATATAGVVNDAYNKLKNLYAEHQIKQAAKEAALKNPEIAAAKNSNWAKSLTGIDIPHAQMDKATLQKTQEMAKAIGPGGELAGGRNVGGVLVGPDFRKPVAAAAESAPKIKMLADIQKFAAENPLARKALAYAARKAANVAVPTVGGALAGQQALQGYGDFKRGDYLGAGLNAIGAGAGAAAMYPPAAPIAIPVSMGADFVNYARQHPETMAKYLDPNNAITFKKGGLAGLK